MVDHTPVLANGETVLWHGKPKRKAFVLTKSLTMMPIAIVWLFFDFSFIRTMLEEGNWHLLPFFAFHLMPVWIWLANIFTANRRWTNTAYYVTNRRIIIQSGFFAVNEISLFYKDMRDVQMRIGFLDKLFHTGDICFNTVYNTGNRNDNSPTYAFEDLEDFNEVYNSVQKIILDIQTDMEYPNALRPSENPGYHTDYNP